MEKYYPINAANPYPYHAPTAVSPAAAPSHPIYMTPVNVHASYEEVNIYAPKKTYIPAAWTSTAIILVLYILLVIILRSTSRI